MTSARRLVLAPAVLLFGIMVAHALLETARDALFLAHLGAKHLASAYLTIAVVATIAVTVMRRLGRIDDPRRLLLASLGIAVVGTGALAWAIPSAPSLVFVLYVWTGLVATLVVPAFWTAIDRSLRVSEAKRVFGAIGAGGVLGAMVGSAVAGALGRVTSAHNLVSAGALMFAVAGVAALVLAPRSRGDEPPVRKRPDIVSRNSRRYVRLLVAIGIVSTMALTIADLTFKRVFAERFAAGDLATAFGTIYTVLNLVGLVIQLAVTPRLLARWGVGSALTVLPVLLVATASGFALTGGLLAILALKLADGGLRHSLHRVASEILYLPVPASMRDARKPVADAISQRGGQALAALLWFAFAMVAAPVQALGVLVVLLAVIWLIGIHVGRRAYVAQFRTMLQAGEVERDVRIPALDSDSIELLNEALSSPDELQAIGALELLARGGRVPALVLYHPRDLVVRRALRLFRGQPRPDVAAVLGHLIQHSDPKIRAAALVAVSRDGVGRAQLEAAAVDPDPDIRAAALVGLAEGSAAIDERVGALLRGSLAEHLALARAIGYAPHERFRGVLNELLATDEPQVMREVLRLLAISPELADLDRMLALLENAHVRGDVRRVLLASGHAGLGRLLAALDDPRTPLGVRRHLPRTISRYRSRIAANALLDRLLREPDGTTEFKILRALGRMRADDPRLPVDATSLRKYVQRAIADAVRYNAFLVRLTDDPFKSAAADLIRELLADKRRWAIEHTFRALGILHPRDDMRSVHDAITSPIDSRRSAAREILESIVPLELRTPLLGVLGLLDPDERPPRHPESMPTEEALLGALLSDPSESLKCLVAHHVAERHLVALRHDLAQLRPAIGPPLVTYAFDQAMARLDA